MQTFTRLNNSNGRGALLIGGSLSILAGILHILIIIGGSQWYLYFGAGEEMAAMAESEFMYPTIVTTGIAVILIVWGLYAFSGAGILKSLPMMKPVLLIVGIIFTVRGLGVLTQFVMFFIPGQDVLLQDVVFSLVSLIIGCCYLLGYMSKYKKR